MKIVHVDIARQIDFSVSPNFMLVIENSQEFYRLTQQLFNQVNGEDGDFVLSENNILNISNHCLFIYDYFGDILNSKKITNTINNKIIATLKENDFIEDFAKLNTLILQINEKIIEKLDYNIKTSSSVEYENFVKLIQFKPMKSQLLVEDIITYITLNLTKNIDVVIFVSLSSVLSENQINTLLKDINYMQLNVLLIEPFKKYKLDNCETIIIDEDLCVI